MESLLEYGPVSGPNRVAWVESSRSPIDLLLNRPRRVTVSGVRTNEHDHFKWFRADVPSLKVGIEVADEFVRNRAER